MRSDPGAHAGVWPRAGSKVRGRPHGLLALVLASLGLLVLSGCVDIHARIGTRPDVRALESVLTVGRSTQDDVRAALGTPSGSGTEMFPIGQAVGTVYNYQQKQRTMWTYYYEEGTLKDDRRIFLFVFFEADRFDGYMWFSSLPDAGSQASKISVEPKE